jgi:hypothetical protein
LSLSGFGDTRVPSWTQISDKLEKKLAASEKARHDAEAKTASAELALSDKDEQIAQREANIIA